MIASTEEVLEMMYTVAKLHKQKLCEHEGGPADIVPVVFGICDNGDPFMLPDSLDGHPTDHLPILLSAIAHGLTEKNGTMKWSHLAYVVEAYMKEVLDENEEAEEHERGSYQQDYENNPDSKIVPCLVFTIVPWEGELMIATVPFVYGDDGMPVWTDAVTSDTSPQGVIPEIFQHFREFCANEGN